MNYDRNRMRAVGWEGAGGMEEEGEGSGGKTPMRDPWTQIRVWRRAEGRGAGVGSRSGKEERCERL